MKSIEASRVAKMFEGYYESFEVKADYKIPVEKDCKFNRDISLAEARKSDNFVVYVKDLEGGYRFCIDGKKLYLTSKFENSELFSIELDTSENSKDSNVSLWNSGLDPRDRAFDAMKKYESMPYEGNDVLDALKRSGDIVTCMHGIIEGVFDA